MNKFKGEMKDLIGKRYGDLPSNTKEQLLSSYTDAYFGTILGYAVKEPTKIGRYKCILDFDDNVSIPATLIVTESEKVYEIDDNAVFYSTVD